MLLVEERQEDRHSGQARYAGRGFHVEVSFDGDDGFWWASEGTYDLIVLDILLPGRNGFRICGDLRELGIWTPVLMLTAKDGDLDEAEALDTGADDYLTKPFSFPALIARIRPFLKRTGESHPPPIGVGDLRIDPGARRAWFRNVEVPLTSREFELRRHKGSPTAASPFLASRLAARPTWQSRNDVSDAPPPRPATTGLRDDSLRAIRSRPQTQPSSTSTASSTTPAKKCRSG